MNRANQLLLIDSKNDKGTSNQRPLKPIFHKNKIACNASINDSTTSDDMDHYTINNNAIYEEEYDLIECEVENNDQSPKSPPDVYHDYASIAPNVTNEPSISLEVSLLYSSNNDNGSD